MQETLEMRVQSLGQEDTLEKEMATHSSILGWKIPWAEEFVGYSPWGRKESDMIEDTHTTQLNVLFKDSSLCGKIIAVDLRGSNFMSYNLENSNITSK